MNPILPDNFKQLSVSQQAIYAAEALREATDSNLSGDNATLRKRIRKDFGIATSTAERAERLLKLYPELAAEVKAGTRPLPKSAENWKALKTSIPAKEDQETNSSLDSPAPEKEGQRLNLALASPSSSETPKPTTLLIPFEAPVGSPLEPHPLAALFPAMEDGEFAELVEDLKRIGLLTPIVVYEDKILEGRHRDRGCIEAEVNPSYVEYKGDDPLGFVISANLHRRHLTTAQRAAIAAKLATATWGNAQRTNSSFGTASSEITLEKAADRMRVSRTSAVVAKAIAKTDPEVAAQVEAGKLSLNEAATKAGIKSKAKPSKPSHSKTLSAPAPASLDTKDTRVLIPRCEEWLEAMHKDFPGFTLQEIALACGTAATRMMVRGIRDRRNRTEARRQRRHVA
jgi:ParB-like chromosome segregation protein Spo0J